MKLKLYLQSASKYDNMEGKPFVLQIRWFLIFKAYFQLLHFGTNNFLTKNVRDLVRVKESLLGIKKKKQQKNQTPKPTGF